MDRKKKITTEDEPATKKIRTSLPVIERLSFKLDGSQKHYLNRPKNTRNIRKLDLAIGKSILYEGVNGDITDLSASTDPKDVQWAANIQQNFRRNQEFPIDDADQDLFNIITNYLDLFAVVKNNKDYRDIYLGHMLNHLINLRNTIVKNSLALRNEQVTEKRIENCRDQGFVRTSCLIVCPYKKDAYDIIQRLIDIVFGEGKDNVENKKRYEEEFALDASVENPYMLEDHKDFLSGNTDDCFRMGIALSKKSLKLYEPFYKSDIIICSPLGLRMVLEKEEDESHFFSCLQLVVVDGADMILQQNWDNLRIIFEKLLLVPQQILSDISRVRNFCLEGDAKHYAQLLMFSQYQHELFAGMMFERSLNYQGLVFNQPREEGKLSNIEIPLCQELLRFSVEGSSDPGLSRFNFFSEKFGNCLVPNTCIVVPSYFDFVRLRNYFKRREESFVAVHEYAEKKQVKRARDLFYHGLKKVLLITERFHFFHRYSIKGIQRLIFYQIPSHPDFYHEFINMGKIEQKRFLASLLYCKHDRLRLCNTFGTVMANSILNSEKSVQAIVSE